jgi:tRNASer (uridine44-2'-O)-methyltransferase
MSQEDALGNVTEIIENVRLRGMFKTRKPEGKAVDH